MRVALIVLSVIITILTLIQSGKTDAAASLTGKNLALFSTTKERGIDKTMADVTYVLVIAYFVVNILLYTENFL